MKYTEAIVLRCKFKISIQTCFSFSTKPFASFLPRNSMKTNFVRPPRKVVIGMTIAIGSIRYGLVDLTFHWYFATWKVERQHNMLPPQSFQKCQRVIKTRQDWLWVNLYWSIFLQTFGLFDSSRFKDVDVNSRFKDVDSQIGLLDLAMGDYDSNPERPSTYAKRIAEMAL